MNKDERILRRLLWIRHGCPINALYGDDGEMQCSECGIDFRCDEPSTIEEKLWLKNVDIEGFIKKNAVDEDKYSVENIVKGIAIDSGWKMDFPHPGVDIVEPPRYDNLASWTGGEVKIWVRDLIDKTRTDFPIFEVIMCYPCSTKSLQNASFEYIHYELKCDTVEEVRNILNWLTWSPKKALTWLKRHQRKINPTTEV